MTQASPSQFELEELPNDIKLSQDKLIMSEQGEIKIAQVSWRLNNDSV